MADCCSFPSAAELVEEFRRKCEVCGECYPCDDRDNLIKTQSEIIEALLAENAKLKAERDDWRQKYLSSEVDATNLTGLLVQAVADLKYSRVCFTCKHKSDPDCDGCHVNLDKWEWRGIKEEEDATD